MLAYAQPAILLQQIAVGRHAPIRPMLFLVLLDFSFLMEPAIIVHTLTTNGPLARISTLPLLASVGTFSMEPIAPSAILPMLPLLLAHQPQLLSRVPADTI